jgi:hypothetical protein
MSGDYVQLKPCAFPILIARAAGKPPTKPDLSGPSELPSERHPGGHEAVIIHKLPEIEVVQVGVKIGDKLPFQGSQALEGGAEVAVLVHSLDRALQDEGGQAVDLAVIT